MSVALDQLQAILVKIEAADLPILESALLPALEEVANSMMPASAETPAEAIEAMFNPALQQALSALIAKLNPQAPS